MKKIISLLLLSLLVLTACGTQEKEDTATPEKTKTEESTNADKNTEAPKELTAEDEKFIKMINEEDYDTVITESVSLKSEAQKNFYFLASALKKQKDLEAATELDPNVALTEYKVIVSYLNRAKYVPDEIKEKVDTLRATAEKKVEFYTAEVEKTAK